MVDELIGPMTIFIGDTVTVDLSDHFSDPGGGPLTYGATSSSPAVVAASVTGSTLRMVPQAKGAASVEVTAANDHGTSEMDISTTVGNSPPKVVDPIARIEPHVAQVLVFVVSEHIIDPDGDPVSYTAASSNESVVLAGLSGDTLRLEGVKRGNAGVRITATDIEGLSTRVDIPTTVVPMPGRVVLEFQYDAAGGSGWSNSDNWGTDADLATWYGVEVNEQGQVRSLSLGGNNLQGAITPYLAELDWLEYLNLESNGLEGIVPVALTRLPLSELHLTDNPGLAGEVQTAFRTDLADLDVLLAGGTDICAPNDPNFRKWLGGIAERRVRMCEPPPPPAAYLIQAAQSLEAADRVPLVGGKKALLRVFATSPYSTHEGIPPVRATFLVDGTEFRTITFPGKSEPVPVVFREDSLPISANVEIPGDVMRPDLEMVIEIDPEGTLDEELGVAARLPGEGAHEYTVYDVPTFDLTVIPFLWEDDPDSAIIGYARKMEEDEEEYGRLHATYDLLPVNGFEVNAYEPVETSSNNAFDLLRRTDAIRRKDGGSGYFQGQMSGVVTGARGVAWLNHKSSFSIPVGWIIAHELGHNLNLRHAPCGPVAGADPNYPHDDGKIGTWGYDVRNDSLIDPERHYDVMSYCGPEWISDFFFGKALRYRRVRPYPGRRAPSAAMQTLLLWGGLDEQGDPFLEPAFVMEARPGLPASPGEYALTGSGAGGTVLFSLSFDMPAVGDAPGESSHFVFTVPVQAGWAGSLASITLSGPDGSVTMDGDTDIPMTIAVDGKRGPIRAFWDGLRDDSDARAGWVLLRSSGIPDRKEWER